MILFGIPSTKDETGSGAYDDEGVVQIAVRALKEAHPDLTVITDVCLCEYTSHGHCGFVRDGEVDNDITLELLAKTAISHAEAGADVVAPSDMMDGRIGMIRHQLDEEGHPDTAIIAYSAKYASAFYGPFREAAESTPEFGDRRGYQMDPANAREALREVRLDVEEGADMVMVKPALPYLDVIRAVRDETDMPIAAYQVSGEYSMLRAAADNGWLDGQAAALETLIAIRRAGADVILTYFAKEARRRWLAERSAKVPQPKTRSRKDGAAIPLDDTDKRLMNLLQSNFPLGARAVRAARGRARARPRRPDDAHRPPRARADHPRDHADLRHARARLRLDAGRGEGRHRAPAPRGEDHQLAPRRLAQLPAHARVQPLVHDRHPARLRARPGGHARRCSSGSPAPSRSASCRR